MSEKNLPGAPETTLYPRAWGLRCLSAAAVLACTIPAFGVGSVVISQIYGAGGNAGSIYTNDFVELFNRSPAPVSLSGWSLQYTSSGGTSWGSQKVLLPSVLLDPGQFLLVQLGTGGGGTTPLPTPDATGTFNISANSGKLALTSSTTSLTGSCPLGDGTLIDLVGYGASANCYEGSGRAPYNAGSGTGASFRLNVTNGCQDTDQNGSDFVSSGGAEHQADPRNTQTPPAQPCSGGGACCAVDGSCTITVQVVCIADGGVFLGDGSACTPNPCPQPLAISDLGTLGGGFSSGLAISGDGLVVTGSAYNGASQQRAFRWTSGVMSDLGTLPMGSDSIGWGVNGNGSAIAGESNISGGADRAMLWTQAGGMQDLGVQAPSTQSRASALNADGSVVIGYLLLPSRAFRWTSVSGIQALPYLPGSAISFGLGVSADGAYAVGDGPNSGGSYRALRWLGTGAAQDLGLCAGASESHAYGASADGSVVVGTCRIGSNSQASRWTSGGGIASLGVLAGGTSSIASAVNYDGSVVVGKSVVAGADRAFIWTAAGGMQDLNTYLTNLGLNLAGWTLRDARGVSADGSAITGIALHNGNQRAFHVRGMPATDRYYVGPANGFWNNAANWSTTQGGPGGAGVPTYGHNVYITTGNPTVTFDTTYAAPGIQSLTLAGTLIQASNNMVIAGMLTISSGAYQLQGGTLTAATVINTGSLNLTNGATLDVAGVISGNYVTYSGTTTMTGGVLNAPMGTSAGTTIIKTSPATLVFDGSLALNPNNTLEALEGTTIFRQPFGGSPASAYLSIHANATTVRIGLTSAFPRNTWGDALTINTPGTTVLDAGADEVLITRSLSIDLMDGGRLDINDNTYVLDHSDGDGGASSYALVRGYVRGGHGGGTWDGTGILSSVAGILPGNQNSAIGVLNNDSGSFGGTPGTPIYTTFEGAPVDASSILVDYTYYGDSDLNGTVNATDLDYWIQGFIDAATARGTPTKTGWVYGDYDYSDAVDMDDVYLLARAYYALTGNVTALLAAIDASALTPAQKIQAKQIICSARQCVADFNNSCAVSVQDLFDYLKAWFAMSPSANINGVGGVTIQDLFDYLKAYFLSCPA